MLSLEKCRQILNKKEPNKYSDKQVEEIRMFLYKLAEIEKLNFQKNDYKKKSSALH